MAIIKNIQPLTELDKKTTYLVLISPEKIPHLAIVENDKYYSLTHKKAVIGDDFESYLRFFKQSQRKILLIEVKLELSKAKIEDVFKRFSKAAVNDNTCLAPIKSYLFKESKANFVYELVPELQEKKLIGQSFHINMDEDIDESKQYQLRKYTKDDIFSYIDSLNKKYANRG